MTGKQGQDQTCLACQRKWIRVYPLCNEEAAGWSDLIVFYQSSTWLCMENGLYSKATVKPRGHQGNIVGVQVADDILDEMAVVKARSE